MKLAKDLILSAKENGADVAKFQVFDTDKVFGREGNDWYDYNCSTQLSRDDVRYLAEECRNAGIEFMASAFDAERVEWLEDVGVKRHKIASRSIRDKALLKAVIKTGKPIIASLGFWEDEDFPVIFKYSHVDYLYCVARYPAELEDLHLGSVDFDLYSGFSDHTTGITAAMIALSKGARIIEKHFTLDKNMYGPDHSCSMTPVELKRLHDFRCQLQRSL
ncbi:MAG: N-acetylneuraminate synthase family protein [Candidatus Omnitrophica bacterium]|nr:N-acetylneuraminate synthase family protein [Candidatus Omnitrophota bacterium]